MKVLTEQAYTHIRGCLIRGEMPAGSRVSEGDIARSLGISRTPVREAIAQLISEGLVEQPTGGGPRVKVLERRDLEELFELREMLECGAVQLAAPRITDAELDELRALFRQYKALDSQPAERSSDPPQDIWLRAAVLDMAFHIRIMAAARNQRLLRLVSGFHILTRVLRRRANRPDYPQSRRRADVIAHHEAVLEGMVRRDGAAAEQAMRHHIRSAKDYHLHAYDWEQREHRSGLEELLYPKSVIAELEKLEQKAIETGNDAASAGEPGSPFEGVP